MSNTAQVRIEREDGEPVGSIWAVATRAEARGLLESLEHYFADVNETDPGWHTHVGEGDHELTIAIEDPTTSNNGGSESSKSEHDLRSVWAEDAAVLSAIGAALETQPTVLSVRLPISLAEAALRSWQRDDNAELGAETPAQQVIRDKAATLALIGLAVETCGRLDGDGVVIELPARFIGTALDAAESGDPD